VEWIVLSRLNLRLGSAFLIRLEQWRQEGKQRNEKKKTHKSSIELTDNNLESEVWLMAVPMVAWGGLVVPIVPEAVTWAWA
jgi:hypothetical protein